MRALRNKNVLLGVCGGIAAYKAAELIRQLRDAGADVRVVMTTAAEAFITPLTLQALSGHPVHQQLLDAASESAMGHIELARWADVLLIAPATADTLARLAQGRANDLLCAAALACRAPKLLAPAMNTAMWEHPATQDNVQRLRGYGYHLTGPDSGDLACGESGAGRMQDPDQIIAAVEALQGERPLQGVKLLLTAGPTREAIDPVRFLSNRSSGKMGYALAEAARQAGAEVTLVSGPVALAPPLGVRTLQVETAAEMHATVMDQLPACQLFIATAAVADYRPKAVPEAKIKKAKAQLEVALEPTTDILAAVASHSPRPFCVGFAAETHDLEHYAQEKLQRKGLDLVVANQVGPQLGFDQDENQVLCLWDGGREHLPLAPKRELARQIIDLIVRRYEAKH